MSFSRRRFLHTGVLTAAACTAKPLLGLGGRRPPVDGEASVPVHQPAVSTPKSGTWQDHAAALDNLNRAAFTAAIGTNFKVFPSAANSSPVWVTLLAVEDLPKIAAVNPASFAVSLKKSSTVTATSGFVLVFGGSSALTEQTHLFEHDALGRFALLTVPAGNGTQLYMGTVNRLDGGLVVARPFGGIPVGKTQVGSGGAQSTSPAVKSSGAVTASPATSSGVESRSPGLSENGLSENQAVQRVLVRD